MSQAAIEDFLRQKIGLDIITIGSSTITRAVHQRLVDCDLPDLQTYLTRLQTSTEELDTLVESIVVPETWFFRDQKPFSFLKNYIQSEWLPKHSHKILRVLSVPCSTGEEPYSIAITLLETGLAAKKFNIDAVDLSKKAINSAKRAVYTSNSFRNNILALRQHYFTQTDEGYQLCESIRRTVNFTHGNLLDPHFLYEKPRYHIVFCRNLLIYFDKPARAKAFQVLDRLLTSNGLLFLGHSETGSILPRKFLSVRYPLAFAFRKSEDSVAEKQKSTEIEKGFSRLEPENQEVEEGGLSNLRGSSPSITDYLPSNNEQQTIEHPEKLLETARSLADQGQLSEATKLCELYLSQNRVNAEAYVLLGQLCQATDQAAQAEDYFQKAIYLEPNYYEALIHLALIKQQHGDIKAAELLRQRIQRLPK